MFGIPSSNKRLHIFCCWSTAAKWSFWEHKKSDVVFVHQNVLSQASGSPSGSGSSSCVSSLPKAAAISKRKFLAFGHWPLESFFLISTQHPFTNHASNFTCLDCTGRAAISRSSLSLSRKEDGWDVIHRGASFDLPTVSLHGFLLYIWGWDLSARSSLRNSDAGDVPQEADSCLAWCVWNRLNWAKRGKQLCFNIANADHANTVRVFVTKPSHNWKESWNVQGSCIHRWFHCKLARQRGKDASSLAKIGPKIFYIIPLWRATAKINFFPHGKGIKDHTKQTGQLLANGCKNTAHVFSDPAHTVSMGKWYGNHKEKSPLYNIG